MRTKTLSSRSRQPSRGGCSARGNSQVSLTTGPRIIVHVRGKEPKDVDMRPYARCTRGRIQWCGWSDGSRSHQSPHAPKISIFRTRQDELNRKTHFSFLVVLHDCPPITFLLPFKGVIGMVSGHILTVCQTNIPLSLNLFHLLPYYKRFRYEEPGNAYSGQH